VVEFRSEKDLPPVKPESQLLKPWLSGSGLKPYSASQSHQLVSEGHIGAACDSLSYSANLISWRKNQVMTWYAGIFSPREIGNGEVGGGEEHA
jgi:hypothetical protein